MAPSVSLDSYQWDNDLAEMTSRAATGPGQAGKIHLSNHSYVWLTGWDQGSWSGYEGPHFWGVAAERESRWFGQYDDTAADWDALHYGAPYFLAFKAAGNDRNDAAPPSGTVYYYLNSTLTGWVSKSYDPATDPLADGWDQGGYDTMDAVACAKNLMTVGAVYDAVSGGVRSPANGVMSSFSNWGPTDDGRIKPDLVANGIQLRSSYGLADDDYASASGTSMATPNASGSAVLLVEYFGRLFPGQAMRASTLKGLILHTADDLGEVGPDYAFGWGLMNVEAAASQIRAHAEAVLIRRLYEGRLTPNRPGESFPFLWDGVNPIRATLCWTDPPGAEKTGLDDRTPLLVNDLDLRVLGPGGAPTYYPYRLDVNHPTHSATTGDNVLDNVEQVLIAAPAAGTYTVVVSHKGTLADGGQHYSLILSGQSPESGLPPAPEIALSVEETEISDGQVAAVDFGTVRVDGAPPAKVFTVKNEGTAPLRLDPPGVPAGFTLTEGLEASLAPGVSDTFTVQLDTAVVGTKTGSISLANNDGDENPFSFPISGTVTAASPTAAVVLAFRAVRLGPHQAALQWTTGVEFDLLGFHVEQLGSDGFWFRLTPQLIPALGSSRPQDYQLESSDFSCTSAGPYRLLGIDRRGGMSVLAETMADAGIRLSIRREGDGALVVVEVRGSPNSQPVLEGASDVRHGPWRVFEVVRLDGMGVGRVRLSLEGQEAQQFYRLRWP
jgi:hypothetical protein